MGRKKYKTAKKQTSSIAIFAFLGLVVIVNLWFILLPLGLVAGYIYKRDAIHRFFHRDSVKRLENLQLSIRSGYDHHQQLLEEKGEDGSVLQLRSRLLGDLFELDQLYQKVGKYLDAYASKDVVDTLQLSYQLKMPQAQETTFTKTESPKPAEEVMDEQAFIANLAPEILETYCNIQRDNLVILDKLEEASDKKEELRAIHESNMSRFQDILAGYLKIKQSPKDFFNAEERMEKAKLAMETFDRDLDQTIRQFNEADMQDFEVSLRMMKKEEE